MDNEADGVSTVAEFLRRVFRSEEVENWTGPNNRRRLGSRMSQNETNWSPLGAAVPLSRIAFIDAFSAMAITVSALSYSAISQTPPPPLNPPPLNPIHIILQSSSSCSRGLSIFYFPFPPPPLLSVLQPSPSSRTLFQQFSLSLSEVFFSLLSLSFTLLLDLVRVSPL